MEIIQQTCTRRTSSLHTEQQYKGFTQHSMDPVTRSVAPENVPERRLREQDPCNKWKSHSRPAPGGHRPFIPSNSMRNLHSMELVTRSIAPKNVPEQRLRGQDPCNKWKSPSRPTSAEENSYTSTLDAPTTSRDTMLHGLQSKKRSRKKARGAPQLLIGNDHCEL